MPEVAWSGTHCVGNDGLMLCTGVVLGCFTGLRGVGNTNSAVIIGA